MKMERRQTVGFGFCPEEAQQHFLVVSFPVNQRKDTLVYERFVWDEEPTQSSEMDYQGLGKVRLKIRLNHSKWEKVYPALEAEFNRVLKAEKKKVGRFRTGQVPVDRLLGKEMLVLLWAIEDADPTLIPLAIRNWLGLTREERWWLFTMTNAITGEADDKRGWRIALRYALTDNFKPDQQAPLSLFAEG